MGFFSCVHTPIPKEKDTVLLVKPSLSMRHGKCQEKVTALPAGRMLIKRGEKGDGGSKGRG